MHIDRFSIRLVKLDFMTSYIPVVSTVTNLAGLFLKYAVIPFISEKSLQKKHYFSYLNEKNTFRCIWLLVPLLGNITIALLDFYKRQQGYKLWKLAMEYLEGENPNRDDSKGNRLLQKAISKNDTQSMIDLGESFKLGRGVPKDESKALHYFTKAAIRCDPHGILALAECYKDGYGVLKDEAKAFNLTKIVADGGCKHALFYLGGFHYLGLSTPVNHSKAFELMQKAAHAGHPEANHNLGLFYNKGVGVSVDQSKSIEYYTKAAGLGCEPAIRRLNKLKSQN